ncbi:MAG: ornithine carbamoyltransferase [Thermodesulfobacteriota bacterium]
MKKRDFLTLSDLDRSEIEAVLTRAVEYKAGRAAGFGSNFLKGRTIGMIFNKPSTRTRVSFEVGIYEMGGRVVYMSDEQTHLSRSEPISHTARVLSRYLHALIIRTYEQAEIEEMAGSACLPVINALTDRHHPCQVLSDLFTVRERLGRLDGLKMAWIGDGYNMAHSWIQAATIMDFELRLAIPEGYGPDPDILDQARAKAGKPIVITRDPLEAARGAEVINTDVWASMGQEEEEAKRARDFSSYQVNSRLMAEAADGAMVLHCLPAHLGQEITEDVFEGPRSFVFDQAENRLHVQKALLEFLLNGPPCRPASRASERLSD